MRKPLHMERRHFQFIAATVAAIACPITRKLIAEMFSDKLRVTNEHFQVSRFLDACGVS
jgi:hypothetical protein